MSVSRAVGRASYVSTSCPVACRWSGTSIVAVMGLKDITARSAVLSAMAEFDSIGREVFLAKHRFGKARSYFIEHDGRRYDSKAIVGVAHGIQHGEALASADFSGGEGAVVPCLEGLGFEVSRPARRGTAK